MFTSIFGYGPGSGSETLELRIRIRQKFRILADPDPQHWVLVQEKRSKKFLFDFATYCARTGATIAGAELVKSFFLANKASIHELPSFSQSFKISVKRFFPTRELS
jgi:hypothetical protein